MYISGIGKLATAWVEISCDGHGLLILPSKNWSQDRAANTKNLKTGYSTISSVISEAS